MPVKLTVWQPPEATEKELFVALTKLPGDDEILIQLVDSKGKSIRGGSLMVLTPAGYYPLAGISSTLGIAVRGYGKMQELYECPI